jgi:hypothetical protein
MLISDAFKRTWKKAVVIYFEALSQSVPEEAEETHEKRQSV